MKKANVLTLAVLATVISFSAVADDKPHGHENGTAAPAAANGQMPMMNGQHAGMQMMAGQKGGMPMMQMMQQKQAMMQAHMTKMETHMANVEALLKELVEQGKK